MIEGLFQYCLFIKLFSLVVLDLHEPWSFSVREELVSVLRPWCWWESIWK